MNATVSSLRLGRLLRAMRVQADLTGSYVARTMGYSPAKLSRQEHGTHVISEEELRKLVVLYRRPDARFDELEVTAAELEALRQQSTRGHNWWMEYEGDLPVQLKTYMELEQEASRIVTFSGEVIHGLLQTPEYVRTQSVNFGASDRADIERTVWLRTQRRDHILNSASPPELDVILTESALRRCVSSGLHGQITSLLEDSERPNVTMRVLPNGMGIHGIAGIYIVLEPPDGKLHPVMYLEYVGGSILVEEEVAVELTMNRHRLLTSVVDPDDSRRLLKELIATTSRSGEGIGVA